jgi:hypothetical protein
MAKDLSTTGAGGVIKSAAALFELAGAVTASVQPVRVYKGIDATDSRSPTWQAAKVTSGKVVDAFAAGQEAPPFWRIAYFRGRPSSDGVDVTFGATIWTQNVPALKRWMDKVTTLAGSTQISRLMRDCLDEHKQLIAEKKGGVNGFIFVGDKAETSFFTGEDSEKELLSLATEMKAAGIPAYMFQEGNDRHAMSVFSAIADITGGSHMPFKVGAFKEMEDGIKVASAKIAGPVRAKKLLQALRNDKTLAPAARRMLLGGPGGAGTN